MVIFNTRSLETLKYTILRGARAGQQWEQGEMGILLSFLTSRHACSRGGGGGEEKESSRVASLGESAQEYMASEIFAEFWGRLP